MYNSIDPATINLDALRNAGLTRSEARVAILTAHVEHIPRDWRTGREVPQEKPWKTLFDELETTFPEQRSIPCDVFPWTPARAAMYKKALTGHHGHDVFLEALEHTLPVPHCGHEQAVHILTERKLIGTVNRIIGVSQTFSEWCTIQLTELYANHHIDRVELRRALETITSLEEQETTTATIPEKIIFTHFARYSALIPDGDLREPLSLGPYCVRELVAYMFYNARYTDDPDYHINWLNFPSHQVQRFFTEHQNQIVRYLENLGNYALEEQTVWDTFTPILIHAGDLPPQILTMLVTFSVKGRGALQQNARAALPRIAGWENHVINQLTNGTPTERKHAAECMKHLPRAAFTTPLHTALGSKLPAALKPLVLSAYVAAFECSGGALSRDVVEQFAQSPKKLPKAAQGVGLADLPQLVWADGEPVSAAVQHWFIATLITEKAANPTAIVRQVAALLTEASVGAFADAALALWLAHDVVFATPEVAAERARARMISHYPSLTTADKHYAVAYADFLDHELKYVDSTAMPWIGVLSLSALIDTAGSLAGVQEYVLKWYKRSAQATFFITLLGVRSDAQALAILTELRESRISPRLRRCAETAIKAVAEQQGVPYQELALGAISRHELSLNGSRTFTEKDTTYTATLHEDGAVSFQNSAGKTVKSLPWKWAKAEVAALKKTVKKGSAIAVSILRDAIATDREWDVTYWRDHFLTHPLIVRLFTRTVWQEVADGAVVRTFRVVGDGSFTDAADNDVPAPVGPVRLAYATNTPEPERAAWQNLFKEYELTFLLPQFEGVPVALTDPKQTAFDQFNGQLVAPHGLMKQATELGFQRFDDGESLCNTLLRPVPDSDYAVVLDISPIPVHSLADVEMSMGKIYVTAATNVTELVPLVDVPAALVHQVHADYVTLARHSLGGTADA